MGEKNSLKAEPTHQAWEGSEKSLVDLLPLNSEPYSNLLLLLKLKRFLFQLSLERSHLIAGEDIIFCAFFWAIPSRS